MPASSTPPVPSLSSAVSSALPSRVTPRAATRTHALHLQRARDEERAALARELHDELGALLTAARLDLAWLSAQACCQQHPEFDARLRSLDQLLRQGIEFKQRVVEDLYPSLLTHVGLAAAVQALGEQTARRFEGQLETHVDPSIKVPRDVGLALYRVLQESLTNALRHAKASAIMVTLSQAGSQVVLEVVDNGVGFDPDQPAHGQHGVQGMHERLTGIRGALHIMSRPGRGTRVLATVHPGEDKGAYRGELQGKHKAETARLRRGSSLSAPGKTSSVYAQPAAQPAQTAQARCLPLSPALATLPSRGRQLDSGSSNPLSSRGRPT